MKLRKTIILMALTGILLAACSPQIATEVVPAAATAAATASTSDKTPVVASGPSTCTAVSILPTPGPTETSLFPPPTDQDWVQGPIDAIITFTEYSDFQ